MPSTTAPQSPTRAPSLGVIFLTLYIDLVGFSIIFPIVPELLGHYLAVDGQSGLLGWMLAGADAVAQSLGRDSHFAAVLFGGILTSFYAILQFFFAPIWGALSDRHGRRGILRITIAGTALGYLLWVVSSSFWVFFLSRIVSGAFSGNLSVATAAVADATSRQDRSRAMGLVGAAFGLGLVTGPAIGGIASGLNLVEHWPSLARFGINPFSVPALASLLLCLANLAWVALRFGETLPADRRGQEPEKRVRNPLLGILSLENPAVRRANFVAFVFALAFVAMESSLTFLAVERFSYSTRDNTVLLVYLGVCSIVTQGFIVRRLLRTIDEIPVLNAGLALSAAGLVVIGFAGQQWMLYLSLGLLAIGAGLVNPSTTGLISLYSDAAAQGRALGVFRSLGSLARAITPVLAGIVFWIFSSRAVFLASGALAIIALGASRTLPKPEK